MAGAVILMIQFGSSFFDQIPAVVVLLDKKKRMYKDSIFVA